MSCFYSLNEPEEVHALNKRIALFCIFPRENKTGIENTFSSFRISSSVNGTLPQCQKSNRYPEYSLFIQLT